MSANKVFINHRNIVEIIVTGDQTEASVRAMADDAYQLCAQLRAQQKPALILDNLLAMGNVPPEARALVVDLIRSDQFDKLAMVGSDTLLRFGANLMLQATGKGSRVKYFDSYDSASDWLI